MKISRTFDANGNECRKIIIQMEINTEKNQSGKTHLGKLREFRHLKNVVTLPMFERIFFVYSTKLTSVYKSGNSPLT